jgi:hypothetical protein
VIIKTVKSAVVTKQEATREKAGVFA